MKTKYYLSLILAASLAACAPEGLRPQGEREGLMAVMDADLAATKSILVDNPGVKLESYWQAGDEIGVYGGSSENVLFQLKAEDISSGGRTAEFRSESTIPSGRLTAYAPYQKGAKKDGEAIVVDFPARQQYLTNKGVVVPDPAAHILLGEGTKAGGLSFRPVAAVLKIGQVFEKETVVKAVEFRDLSGASVSGAMKVTPGSTPKGEITGDGKVLTLDLGDGLEYPEGAMRPLFLIVPARTYEKGFEIIFIDDKDGRTVRTVGTTQGKTLERGVVYLIGDISGQSYPVDAKTELYEGATIMTPELLDKVTLIDAAFEYLYDADGNISTDKDGVPARKPVLTMMVHKDLHPAVGNWLIFDQPTETLPEGGVYRITECRPYGDSFEVVAHVEENFAAPFKNMTVGSPILDEAGNIVEDGGLELDLASHLSAIIDDEGNSIPFSIGPGGEILFSEEATAALMAQPETKGVMSKTFSPNKLFFKHSAKNAEVTFGAQLKLQTRFSACFADGEIQYIHVSVEPEFELSADFVLKAEFNLEQPFHLINLIFTPPIMIAPGVVLTVNLDLSGAVGVGGNVQFSTSVSYKYNMGRFVASYTTISGFDFRHRTVPVPEAEITPSLGGASASIYAFGKAIAAPYFSLYGMLGLGVEAGLSLKFGAMIEDKTKSTKLFLTPELELIPSIAVLGGRLTKRFSDFTTNIEFDPIWEQYLSPKVERAGSGPTSVPLTKTFYDFEMGDGVHSMQVTKSPEDWSYYVELKEKTPVEYNLELRIYESEDAVNSEDMFVWSAPEGVSERPFSEYLAAGIPHMYFYLDWIRMPGSARLVASHLIGTYPALTDGQVFDGTWHCPSEVSSGHAYYSAIYMIDGNSSETLISVDRTRIYYWPHNFWGGSYKESEVQDFHGSGNTGDGGNTE